MLFGFLILLLAGLALASPQAEYFKKLQERKILLQKLNSIDQETSRLSQTKTLLNKASTIVTELRNESRSTYESTPFDDRYLKQALESKKQALLAALKTAQRHFKEIIKRKEFSYIANIEFITELLGPGRKFGDPSKDFKVLEKIWGRAWEDLGSSITKSSAAIKKVLDKQSEAIVNAHEKSQAVLLKSARILKGQLDVLQHSISLLSPRGSRYDPKKFQESVYKWLEDKTIQSDNGLIKYLEPFLSMRVNIDQTMEDSNEGSTIFYSLPEMTLVHTRAIALLNLLNVDIDGILESISLRVQ